MKTLVLSLAALICFTSVNAQAVYVNENINHPTAPSTDKQSAIFSHIQENMRVPAGMKSEVSSERIRVVFTIDENGNAHVVDVNTRRPDLRSSVIRQFEAIDFSDSKDTNGQQYSIWLNFNVM
jgi:hypothetical protein